MVSNVRYRSFKKTKRTSFFKLVCIVTGLFIIASQPEIMLFVVGVVYVSLGVIVWPWESPQKIRSAGDLLQRFFEDRREEKQAEADSGVHETSELDEEDKNIVH
jgi:hypothetical protein